MKWISCKILLLCLLLTGCGLHLRQPQDFPKALHHLSFSTSNVYQGISAEVERLLQASKVELNSNAPLHLSLSNSHFHTEIPIVFSSASAHAYTYTLSVTLSLTLKGKTLIRTLLHVRKSVTYNVNQVGKPVVTPLMRQRLTEALVNRIYDLLASQQVQQKIEKAHAN